MRNYDRVSEYIQATADLMREGKQEGINSQQSHHKSPSAVYFRWKYYTLKKVK